MKSRLLSVAALTLASLFSAGIARADDRTAATSAASAERSFYLSLAPVSPLVGLVEVQGEYRLSPQIGVGGLLGGGSVRTKDNALVPVWQGGCNALISCSRGAVWEVGAQAYYYALGHFDHGLRLGGQAIYLGTSYETDYPLTSSILGRSVRSRSVGHDLGVAALVGYKLATGPGFTFDVDGGPMFTLASQKLGARVTLDLGWSF